MAAAGTQVRRRGEWGIHPRRDCDVLSNADQIGFRAEIRHADQPAIAGDLQTLGDQPVQPPAEKIALQHA